MTGDPSYLGPPMQPAEVRDPVLRDVLGHWLGLRGDAPGMPGAQGWTLTDLSQRVLSHLAVCTGFDDTGRLVAEFVGSQAAMFGGASDFAGRHLDEIYPPAILAVVNAVFREVERQRSPFWGEFVLGRDGVELIITRRAYMPLSDPDDPDRVGPRGLFVAAMVYELSPAGRDIRPKVLAADLETMRFSIRPIAV